MNRKVNYYLIGVFSVSKLTEAFLTYIGVILLGAIELNPIGFNWIMITMIFLGILFFIWANHHFKEKWFHKYFSYILIIGIILNILAIIINSLSIQIIWR